MASRFAISTADGSNSCKDKFYVAWRTIDQSEQLEGIVSTVGSLSVSDIGFLHRAQKQGMELSGAWVRIITCCAMAIRLFIYRKNAATRLVGGGSSNSATRRLRRLRLQASAHLDSQAEKVQRTRAALAYANAYLFCFV